MDESRKRRTRLRSFAIGGVVGAAGTIATVRRLRRSRDAGTTAGLAAFESAPCFEELHAHGTEARDVADVTGG
jgi:hypothetical protein